MECNRNKTLSHDEVCKMFGKKRTTLYRWRQKGKFPKPIRDPGGYLMWREEAIEEWLNELEAKSTSY